MKRLRHLGTLLENWQLLRPRTGRAPTLRAWFLLLVLCAIIAITLITRIHPFLAVTDRVPAEILVVEGWVPDFALRAALDEFRRGNYRELISTGGPLDKGEMLSAYGSYAEVGRASLERLGAPAEALRAAPAPRVLRDRTFTSAVALRQWLRQRGPGPVAFTVITTDAHARRTRLMFDQAFHGTARIGIIAVPDERFDGVRWWRSSAGFRVVTDEFIAYAYARLFFSVADDLRDP